MVAVAAVSLSAQLPADGYEPRVLVIEAAGGVESYLEPLRRLSAAAPHRIGFGRRRLLGPALKRLHKLVADRQADHDAGATRGLSHVLILFGLQGARELRDDDGAMTVDDGPAVSSPRTMLQDLLRDGPEVGVHVVLWSASAAAMERSIDRRSVREIALRVVMQASMEDSQALLDHPDASRLGPNRALFYDEDEGAMVKFRPYGMPDDAWWNAVAEVLAAQPEGAPEVSGR